MSKFLIHIHSGPELKNKATLGILVAVTAFNKGNEVNVFLAADGVHLLNVKKEGEVVRQGTGDLKSHLDVLKENDPTRPLLGSCQNAESPVTGKSGVKMFGPYHYVPPVYWFEDTKHGGAYGYNTETGPGAQPTLKENLLKMVGQDHLWPIDSVWEYHCARNSFGNLNKYNKALFNRYGEFDNVDDYLDYAQLANYEAVKGMFEAFAAYKPNSTGVIQWIVLIEAHMDRLLLILLFHVVPHQKTLNIDSPKKCTKKSDAGADVVGKVEKS